MKESKTAGLLSGRSLDARMPRLKSGSGCDAIENLSGLRLLLRRALLLSLLSREVSRAEFGGLRLLLRRALLLSLLSREVSRAEFGGLRLLLRRALLLSLLCREVSRAEVGLLHIVLLGLFLLRFLLLGGGQLIALDDAADWGCRVRWQAHRGEKAERDSDSSDLAHGVCPLNGSTRMAGAFLSGSEILNSRRSPKPTSSK